MIARAFVASVGARTSIALGAKQTGFLFRAGSAGMAMAPILDEAGEPVTLCLQPTLDPWLHGPDRAARLGVPPLEEALAPLRRHLGGLRLKVVLCIDEQYAREARHGERSGGADIVAYLRNAANELVPGVEFGISAQGAAGAAFALEGALEAIASRTFDAIVLGGVHTDYDPETIRFLESQGRLYTPSNLDALIPGEAAAWVVLMRGDTARRLELPTMCAVHSVATGFEEATPDNDEPAYKAQGLTLAMKLATKVLVDERLTAGWSLTDLTFEMRKLYEWQAAFTRTRKVWGEPFRMDSPAQRLGRLGAATMPLQLVLAAEAWHRGYATSDYAVAFAGSDDGQRGVVVLGRP